MILEAKTDAGFGLVPLSVVEAMELPDGANQMEPGVNHKFIDFSIN